MACRSIYDEMMSLKLDGLLSSEDERLLQAHVDECTDCAVLWEALLEADTILWTTAKAPVAVPAGFQAAVMVRIAATPVYRPVLEELPVAVPVAVPAAVPLTPVTAPAAGIGISLGNADTLQEWQRRLSGYLRGAAAVLLSVAGTGGLVLALMLTGIIKVGGPVAGFVAMLRTFFSALNTWLSSLFAGVGTGAVAGVALVMAIMALVAWQLVATYHRSVALEHGNAGQFAEALG